MILVVLSLLLIGCKRVEHCENKTIVINNTFTYYYHNTTIREIEKPCEYSTKYVEGLIQEAKKCEEDFDYIDLRDCEDDLDRVDDRWDDCRDELDDCEDDLCDLNSSRC